MILGGKRRKDLPDQRAPAGVPQDAVKLVDDVGRPVWVNREEWRTKVLPASIQHHWSNPNGLYEVVRSGLEDGHNAEVEAAAEHLWDLRPEPRSACALAIVKMKLGKLDDAERVLRQELGARGTSGIVLTNLAKVFSARGEHSLAMETLWRALEADPNHENALLWYEVAERERGGEAAGVAAFERVAQVPGAWRAQVWLARRALDAKDLGRAQELYAPALALPHVPGDALRQISGDLGARGFLREAVALVRPRYDPVEHGWETAHNLLNALHGLGEDDELRQFLESLPGAPHPGWIGLQREWREQLGVA